MAARELGWLSRMNALSLVTLYASSGSPTFETAAVRWLARLALEGRDVRLADIQLAAGSARVLARLEAGAGGEDAPAAALIYARRAMDKAEIDAIRATLDEKTIHGDTCLVCGNRNFVEGTVDFRRTTPSMTRTDAAFTRICRFCGHMSFFASQDSRT